MKSTDVNVPDYLYSPFGPFTPAIKGHYYAPFYKM